MKKYLLVLLTTALAFGSCTDDAGVNEKFDKPNVEKPGGWDDPTEETDYDKYTLKELANAAGFRMGVAATKGELDKSSISSIVYGQFSSVTFGNEMKNASVMTSTGSLNFTTINQMLADLNANQMDIYGHVLGWHSQQQTAYLNKLVQDAAVYGPELKSFIDLESDASDLGAWGSLTKSKVLDSENPINVFAGDKSLKLVVTASTNAYDAQANIDIPNAEVGKTYNVCFWMKASAEGSLRLSTTDGQYLYDPTTIGTAWTYYTAPVTVNALTNENTYSVRLDLGLVSTTYYMDNVRVVEAKEEEKPDINYISADDILGDGNFEDYATIADAKAARGWDNYGKTEVAVVDNAHGGKRAVEINALAAADNNYTYQLIWPKDFAAPSDGVYVIGMWVKALAFNDPTQTSGHFQLTVSTPNATGTQYPWITVTDEWTYATVTLDAATYGIKAGDKITIQTQAGGTDSPTDIRQMRFLVDDMQVYPEGSDPNPGGGDKDPINKSNILDNADFEAYASLEELQADGWGGYYIGFTTTEGYSDSHAARINSGDASEGMYNSQLWHDAVLAEAAGDYTVSFYARTHQLTLGDGMNFQMQIEVTPDGGTKSTLYKSPSDFGGKYITDEWTLFTVNTGALGAGTTIKPVICAGNQAECTCDYVLIDNFQIYPASAAAPAKASRNGLKRFSAAGRISKAEAFKAEMIRLNAASARAAAAMTTTTKTVSESADDRIGFAYKNWVFSMMTELGPKVYAWDGINELFDDGTNKPRTNNRQLMTDGHFYWMDFMGGGEAYALKTFRYAKAIQPDAVLFLDDYNLEYSANKLDAFCAFVEKHKALNLIDGVATQMHTSINLDKAAVDNMFQKLAATGLKVRVSELDIDANPNHTLTSLTPDVAKKQAELYAYIVESFLKNVPAGQRDGITIWGARDDISWINDDKGDAYPLLYDAEGNKKEAYKAVYDVLLKYSGLETPSEEEEGGE